MVTLGKRGDLEARRLAFAFMQSRDAVKKLFDEIAPRFKDRAGGYTRVVKFGAVAAMPRRLSIIEFTGTSDTFRKRPRRSRRKRKSRCLTGRQSFFEAPLTVKNCAERLFFCQAEAPTAGRGPRLPASSRSLSNKPCAARF